MFEVRMILQSNLLTFLAAFKPPINPKPLRAILSSVHSAVQLSVQTQSNERNRNLVLCLPSRA